MTRESGGRNNTIEIRLQARECGGRGRVWTKARRGSDNLHCPGEEGPKGTASRTTAPKNWQKKSFLEDNVPIECEGSQTGRTFQQSFTFSLRQKKSKSKSKTSQEQNSRLQTPPKLSKKKICKGKKKHNKKRCKHAWLQNIIFSALEKIYTLSRHRKRWEKSGVA